MIQPHPDLKTATPQPTSMERIGDFLQRLPISATNGSISLDTCNPRVALLDSIKDGEDYPKEVDSIMWGLIHKAGDGFTVQFPGGNQGGTKTFRAADYKKSGLKGAHEAAREWRDEQAARLTDVVAFPDNEGGRVHWSDYEMDVLAQRIAYLEMLSEFQMPFYGTSVMHFLRMAIVQALPWKRWRKIVAAAQIPRPLVMKLPKWRKFTEKFVAEYKMTESAARVTRAQELAAELNGQLPEAERKKGIIFLNPGEALPEGAKIMNPLPDVAPDKTDAPPSSSLPESPKNAIVIPAGVLGEFIAKAIDAKIEPFKAEVTKRLADHARQYADLSTKIDRFLDTATRILEGAEKAVGECTMKPEDVAELKLMQDMLTEELATLRKLAADFDDGRENIQERLRQIEGSMFRAGIGGVPSPVSNGSHGGLVSGGHSTFHAIETKPCVVPVIGIIGPLPDQFQQICDRVGAAAELIYMNNKHSGNSVQVPSRLQWAICNRFSSHSEENGLRKQLGNDRVMHHPSGGISSIVRQVMEIVEQVNKGAGK